MTERRHLAAPEIVAATRDSAAGGGVIKLLLLPASPKRPETGLGVEGENPGQVAAAADAWADMYAADALARNQGAVPVTHAEIPTSPIRPKKAQNILFGGFVGICLGLFLALVREGLRGLFGRRRTV